MVEVEESRPVLEKIEKLDFTNAKPFVVAGIPAFNEENSIAHIVLTAQKFAQIVIVCDDGSSDMTAQIAERLGADVVKHEKNSGYGAAIASLFKHARELNADVLVTLDADGQHNANEIPNLIKPLTEGKADIVIGSRFIDANGTKEMPLYRRFGAKLITRMVNGSAKNGVSDSQSGFRAYNRKAIEHLSVFEVGMGASVELLLEASEQKLRISEVPSTCKYDIDEQSTSTENPVTHGMGVLMSLVRLIVEERPLMLLGLPGIVFMIAGICFGVWMLDIYALRGVIETNIALASISFVLISFFMLSTSITLYSISRISKRINSKS